MGDVHLMNHDGKFLELWIVTRVKVPWLDPTDRSAAFELAQNAEVT